jgi:hypothetical protein
MKDLSQMTQQQAERIGILANTHAAAKVDVLPGGFDLPADYITVVVHQELPSGSSVVYGIDAEGRASS